MMATQSKFLNSNPEASTGQGQQESKPTIARSNNWQARHLHHQGNSRLPATKKTRPEEVRAFNGSRYNIQRTFHSHVGSYWRQELICGVGQTNPIRILKRGPSHDPCRCSGLKRVPSPSLRSPICDRTVPKTHVKQGGWKWASASGSVW